MAGFEEIYIAYFSDVFMYIKTLSRDESLAEEITSETFFKAMNSIDRFRGDCDIRVWLCQIAKNTYYTHIKKSKHISNEKSIEDISSLQSPNHFEDQLSDWDSAIRIHSVLHDLPEPYKEVFMLRVFSELGFAQIGQIFCKTQNWACVTYHRAKNKIQEELEGKLNDK